MRIELRAENIAQRVLFADKWYRVDTLMNMLAAITVTDLKVKQNRLECISKLASSVYQNPRQVSEECIFVIENYGVWAHLFNKLKTTVLFDDTIGCHSVIYNVVLEMRIQLIKGKDVWDYKKFGNHGKGKNP